MKIVLVSEYFPSSKECNIRGGVEARCFHIARFLARHHDVCVVTSREVDRVNDQTIDNIRVLRVGPIREYSQSTDLIRRLRFVFAILFTSLPFRPDIIDSQAIVTYLPGFLLGLRLRAKKVITIHDLWIGRWRKLFGPKGFIGELYERLYMLLPWDQIIANSGVTKELVLRYFPRKKISVIHNGIDRIQPKGITPQPLSISIVSRLVRYKRIHDVFAALVELNKENIHLSVQIVGSGPEESNLKEEARRLGIDKQIVFHGFVESYEQMLGVIESCRIFCFPTEIEGFGIVVLEAAALQRPYVCTNIPALREVTKNGKGGLLYETGNIQALAKALKRLIYDTKLYDSKVKDLKGLSAEYQWNEKSKETETMYHKLITS